jgi:hypothetical protein
VRKGELVLGSREPVGRELPWRSSRHEAGVVRAESAQESSAGSQREAHTAQGDTGWLGGTPLFLRAGSFLVVGIINLALSPQRLHMLVGIAACLSAASFVVSAWKRTSAKAVDAMRDPVALLLSVWAIGLYGYATAPGDASERFMAGFVGSAYVLFFAFYVLNESRLLEIDRTRSGRWRSGW